MKNFIILIFCFLIFGSAKAGSSVGVLKTANYNHILAKLFYTEEKGGGINSPRVKIIRSKKTIFDKVLKLEEESGNPIIVQRISPPVLQDVDEDWEPEVIIELSTDKNNCCNYTLIYHYDALKKTYVLLAHDWKGIIKGRRLEDIDKDGTPEFISKDIRFSNQYGDKEASSLPIQIWHYHKGEMIDVTKEFPDLVRADAKKYWEQFTQLRKAKKYDLFIIKDILRAYLADKYNLKQEEEGWKLLKEAYRWKDQKPFMHSLKEFFISNNYAKDE